MSTHVFAAVILAALLHASWNALLKSGGDKYASTMALALGSLPLAAACVLVAGPPPLASWPFLLGSVAIHTGYNLALLNAYRAADFTQAYPIARGTAPVLTAIVGATLLGEVLTPVQSLAIGVIAAGVVSMAFAGRETRPGTRPMSRAGLGWALATSVLIAAYSLNDGIGARVAGNSFSYYGATSILTALLMLLVMRLMRPGAVTASLARGARGALLVGGPMSFVAYALVTWAFSQAPIATVSALREVSIVFAMVIGTLVLRERLNWRRIGSTFVTLLGVVLLRGAR